MEISNSTWMMIAFVAGTALSIWKMYPFLVNKTLEDDDTGEDAHNHLVAHMKKVLQELESTPSYQELHTLMTQHKDFDKEKFWRFNENKLRQLVNRYLCENTHLDSLEDIHKECQSK